MTAERRAELVDAWRQIALSYEARARKLREDGDPAFAEEYERVASDYRAGADVLELGVVDDPTEAWARARGIARVTP